MNFESVCKLVLRGITGLILCTYIGCSSFPLRIPTCSHTDQPAYVFKNFDDGHHYVFRNNSKLAASVNTKGGYLQGQFETYYVTGILKYWGTMDEHGHIVSGRYNTVDYKLDVYNIREMSVADEQNAQMELYDIMRNGIRKTGTDQNETDKDKSGKSAEDLLFNCSKSTFHPSVGKVYQHDGRGLRVFQSINDAVMVNVDLSMPGSMFDRLDMRVDTKIPYVDGEALKPGRYEYVGPYTYETIKKQNRTIRRFRQVE